MADWLFCPFWHPKSCHKSTKTSQTPQDMYRSGWGLWLHQIWSTWWKIRGQKAKYGYCDLSQNKEFGLLDSLHNFQPLNFIRNLPKPHRRFRTCIGPVGAFDWIKFGQLDGKLEVKRQNMATAIYAKIRNLDYSLLTTNFPPSWPNLKQSKAPTGPSTCPEESVMFW